VLLIVRLSTVTSRAGRRTGIASARRRPSDSLGAA
jgi:hypothetical protein